MTLTQITFSFNARLHTRVYDDDAPCHSSFCFISPARHAASAWPFIVTKLVAPYRNCREQCYSIHMRRCFELSAAGTPDVAFIYSISFRMIDISICDSRRFMPRYGIYLFISICLTRGFHLTTLSLIFLFLSHCKHFTHFSFSDFDYGIFHRLATLFSNASHASCRRF